MFDNWVRTPLLALPEEGVRCSKGHQPKQNGAGDRHLSYQQGHNLNKMEWATDFLSYQRATILIRSEAWFVCVLLHCIDRANRLTSNTASVPGRQFYVRGGGPNIETRTMR